MFRRTLYFISIPIRVLGDHARAGARPPKWSIETAFGVTVDRCDGVLLVEYILIMHLTIILPNIRF